MPSVITKILLIGMLSLGALPGHTFEICQGPPTTFKTYVGQKQETALSVVPGPKSEEPCTSPVAESVTEEPSWQILKATDGIQITLNESGTIVALKRVPGSAIPHVVKQAARKQGLEVE